MKGKEALFSVILVLLIGISVAAIGAATYIIIWQQRSTFTVREPLSVSSDLPSEATLYPGTHSYQITVTNTDTENSFTAVFRYSIVSLENCTINITPVNGTAYSVAAGGSIIIDVSITVMLVGENKTGSATIDWWIERAA